MIDLKEVSRRIDWIRRQNGLSQEQLARRLHISQPAVSHYLKKRLPPADILLRIARLGNTTVEWILTGQKSYYYGQVKEDEQPYDAELKLLQQLNRLPGEVRQAVVLLIERLAISGSTGGPQSDGGGSSDP